MMEIALNSVFLFVKADEVKELVTQEVVEKCGKIVCVCVCVWSGGVVFLTCTF